MSRSWIALHSGHSQTRTANGKRSTTHPQPLHRLLEGKNLPISTYVLPAQFALYASWRVNSPQLASAMCLANVKPVNNNLDLRVGVNKFDYDANETLDGVDYTATLGMQTVSALADQSTVQKA